MLRHTHYGSDGEIERKVEVYRDSGTVWARVYVAPDMESPEEEREATTREVRALIQQERSEHASRIRERAEKALDTLRTIRDSEGDLTATQLSNAVRFMARVLIALVRLALRRLDGTD